MYFILQTNKIVSFNVCLSIGCLFLENINSHHLKTFRGCLSQRNAGLGKFSYLCIRKIAIVGHIFWLLGCDLEKQH